MKYMSINLTVSNIMITIIDSWFCSFYLLKCFPQFYIYIYIFTILVCCLDFFYFYLLLFCAVKYNPVRFNFPLDICMLLGSLLYYNSFIFSRDGWQRRTITCKKKIRNKKYELRLVTVSYLFINILMIIFNFFLQHTRRKKKIDRLF